MAKLYFYYSAMNAGKSTILLQSSYNYHERNMQTLLFAHELDSRYGIGKITSRIGLQQDAISFDENFDFFAHIKTHINQQTLHCILIDEAHFLSKSQIYQLTEVVDHYHIPILTYGLRSDYMGEPFSGSQYLLAWADELIELKTICHCGSKATMNMRIDAQGHVIRQGEKIVIGGNEDYVATCRKHFKLGNSGFNKKTSTHE